MSVKSSISPTDQQDAFARALVRHGQYASVNAVIQSSLDLLRQCTEALRNLLATRRDGAFVSPSEMDVRPERMIAARKP